MLYSELAKTYGKLFKKYPNISSLQSFGGKILEEKQLMLSAVRVGLE